MTEISITVNGRVRIAARGQAVTDLDVAARAACASDGPGVYEASD